MTDTANPIWAGLHGWSPQGCTATYREAAKFFKGHTDEDLKSAYKIAGEHYAHWHFYAEPELDGEDHEIGDDENGDVVMAVEEMHDALKVRMLISYELYQRAEKAKAAAKKPTKLRAVK